MNTWKASRGSRFPNAGVNLPYIHLFDHEDVYELNIAESCSDSMLPQLQPTPTVDTFVANVNNQMPELTAQKLPPSPHTAFVRQKTTTPTNETPALQIGNVQLAP